MTAVPVPVHFDGHNINIITEDSPSMCKDRTKNLSMYVKKKNKKRRKGTRNGKSTDIQTVDKQSDVRSARSVSYSLSPVNSNRDSSNERTDSISPGQKGAGGHSYKSKTFKDPPTTTTINTAAPTQIAGSAVDHESDIESQNAVVQEQQVMVISSPPKNKGTNPNAKPFVMTPLVATNAVTSRMKPSMNNTRHREDYQPPPRLQNRGGVHGHSHRGGMSPMRPQPHHGAHHITDAQLIAQGLNPAEFGSHDDEAFDDEDDHRQQPKGKERRSLFKTELCREWSTSGWCYYNKRCSFAHGLHELRPVFRSKKWRTKRCRNWHTTGYCPYEHRCQFLHDQSPPRRMTDYAQSNARALVAAQQRMKPLYFHYQVDCDRDTADAHDATLNSEGRKSRENTPSSKSRSNSRPSLESVENHKLYKSVAGRLEAAIHDGAETMSSTSKGKKKKGVKNAVITQFNPSATVYRPRSTAFELGSMTPAQHGGIAPSPFQVYPGAVSPVALPMTPMTVGGMSANQALINALNTPLPTMPNASAAVAATTLMRPPPTNPPANVDSTIYLHFTPSPQPHFPTDSALCNNLGVIPSMNLPPQRDAVGNVEVPASLTPPPTSGLDPKNMGNLQNLGQKYDQMTSMYEQAMNEMTRQHVLAHQQQVTTIHDFRMGPFASNNVSPAPSTSCLLDDDALLQLLPSDTLRRPAVNGHGRADTDDDHKEIEDDRAKYMTRNTMARELTTSPMSMQSGRGTDKSNKTGSNSRGQIRHDRNDDHKEEEGALLSMAGIMPPCPPALQLQSSVDSVVMSAVDAAFLTNASPALIHVGPTAAQHLVQSNLNSVAAHAHAYAHAHAAAQVRGGVMKGQYGVHQPNLTNLTNLNSPFAFLPPGYGDPASVIPAAAAGPYGHNIALRMQPPPTVISKRMLGSIPIPGDGSPSNGSRVE